jgi:hypothetical protein
MKVELHLHTSRYSFCAVDRPQAMLDRLCRLDYDAVFLTEHDALWSRAQLDELQGLFPRLKIFPGLEKSVAGHHLLILGADDPDLLALDDIYELIRAARQRDWPTILAHPFRWQGADAILHGPGPLPDAIERKTCNQQGRAILEAAAKAGALGLATVHADDAHSLDMLGQYWIETDRDFQTPGQLRSILLEGAYFSRECGA